MNSSARQQEQGSANNMKELSANLGSFGANISNKLDISNSFHSLNKEKESLIFIDHEASAFRFK